VGYGVSYGVGNESFSVQGTKKATVNLAVAFKLKGFGKFMIS
jgi:hypothetical protein